jgi:hypothetical protein
MTKSPGLFRFLLIAVPGWMNRQQLQLIDYLREENRVAAKAKCIRGNVSAGC